MPHLVAIDMPAGPEFVDTIGRVLDRGDAFLPLDQRLDPASRRRLTDELGASFVDTGGDVVTLDGGRPTEPGDAVVIATSGSTGDPKGVVLTHDAIQASARLGSRRLAAGVDTHWLACLPLCHVGGLSVVFKALFGGLSLTVHSSFDAERVIDAAHQGCTHVSLVPTALQRVDPSLFRCILLGGSRPPSERPSHVIATYGLTETGGGVVYDGRALDDVTISIASDGEILIKSPTNMRTYRDGTTAIDGDGWLHTGDVGLLTDDVLSVHGRLDDLIKTGGEKVWPDVVERVLVESFPTSTICIVGVDDPEWGQMVVAASTDRRLGLADVRDVVKSSLPAHCAPKKLVHVDEFPRTSIGKVRRAELARLLRDSFEVD
ncbi:MAG: AMP-binding protein [Actinomycetota bacterium]|nr:AMP-binding protein [Actinomycetota bacterium]MDA2971229.1 AMP-binding protein [Actinomycetota bacterium]MDA3001001.1 AMP-binding protein [Actinomycetota bacterium]